MAVRVYDDLGDEAGDAALVDVDARHVPVVEDQRVPQLPTRAFFSNETGCEPRARP